MPSTAEILSRVQSSDARSLISGVRYISALVLFISISFSLLTRSIISSLTPLHPIRSHHPSTFPSPFFSSPAANPPGPTFLPSLDQQLTSLRFPGSSGMIKPTTNHPGPIEDTRRPRTIEFEEVVEHGVQEGEGNQEGKTKGKGNGTSEATSTKDTLPISETSDPKVLDGGIVPNLAPTPTPIKPTPPPTPSPLQRGDLLSIQSPAKSGKTQLCLFLMMVGCLPGWVELELGVGVEDLEGRIGRKEEEAAKKKEREKEKEKEKEKEREKERKRMSMTRDDIRKTIFGKVSRGDDEGSDSLGKKGLRWKLKGTYRGTPPSPKTVSKEEPPAPTPTSHSTSISTAGKGSSSNFLVPRPIDSLTGEPIRLPPTRTPVTPPTISFTSTIPETTTTTTTISLGGKSQTVIFLHPSHHLSPLPILIRSLKAHIKDKLISAPKLAGGGFVRDRDDDTTGQQPEVEGRGHHVPSEEELQQIIDAILETTLRRVYFVPFTTGSEGYYSLCTTLLNIPIFAKDPTRARGEIGLVIVDGFGDGYWVMKWKEERERVLRERGQEMEDVVEEQDRAQGQGQGQGQKKRKRQVEDEQPAGGAVATIKGSDLVGMEDVLRAITLIRKELGSVVILTTQALFKDRPARRKGGAAGAGAGEGSSTRSVDSMESGRSGATRTDDLFWSQHLPFPFPSPFANNSQNTMSQHSTDLWPLTAHITLLPSYTTIRQFKPEITLLQALGEDGEKREKAREKAMVRGLLRVNPAIVIGGGACRGGSGTRVDANATAQVGQFQFGIDEEGLIVA